MSTDQGPGNPEERDGRQERDESIIRTLLASGSIGCLGPVILGIGYGLLFLDSWNVWPAFLISFPLIGVPVGLAIGALIIFLKR
jgi:hypothetical protein